MKPRLLLLDDDRDFVEILKQLFEASGYDCLAFYCISEAVSFFKNNRSSIDLLLCDVNLPDGNGIDFISKVKIKKPELPVVMVSAQGDTNLIVEAITRGASDYIVKPCNLDTVLSKIKSLIQINKRKQTERHLVDLGQNKRIIGKSPVIKNLIREMSKVSLSDSPVVLHGESGTGKTLFAEIIHENSPRKEAPFVTINCAAIPEHLLESEFFGHVKGAFTGAIADKTGKFEYANKGTIFLDEIGDMSLGLQSKLLRVLQGKEFEKVGGLKTIRVDVRVMAATNRNLEELIGKNLFREDLYYRLNVLPIYIPPLRHRKMDIEIFAQHYLGYYSRKLGKTFDPLSKDILGMFLEYQWPGNIRELQNIIERAVVLASPPALNKTDFLIQDSPMTNKDPGHKAQHGQIKDLKEIEKEALFNALEKTGGNVTRTAALLNISRDTVYRRLKKYKVGLKR